MEDRGNGSGNMSLLPAPAGLPLRAGRSDLMKPKIPIDLRERERYVLFAIDPPVERINLSASMLRLFGLMGELHVSAKMLAFNGSHGIMKTTNRALSHAILSLVLAIPSSSKNGSFRVLRISGTLRKIREELKALGLDHSGSPLHL